MKAKTELAAMMVTAKRLNSTNTLLFLILVTQWVTW